MCGVCVCGAGGVILATLTRSTVLGRSNNYVRQQKEGTDYTLIISSVVVLYLPGYCCINIRKLLYWQ
jgi:hypothetical protein